MGFLNKALADLDEMSNPFFPFSQELMFQVCVAAGAQLGWPVYQSDLAGKTITFRATQEGVIDELLGDGPPQQGMWTVFIRPDEKDGTPGVRLNYPISDFEGAVYSVLKKMGLLKNGEYLDPNAEPPRNKPAPTNGKNPFEDEQPVQKTEAQEVPPSGLAMELKALSELHDAGVLSDEEFAKAKSKVLDLGSTD